MAKVDPMRTENSGSMGGRPTGVVGQAGLMGAVKHLEAEHPKGETGMGSQNGGRGANKMLPIMGIPGSRKGSC